ncbi:protein of unknown function [Methylorubrum extorquens]|uniref:Sulfotransferase n=1 Tax=Methylorubrum extorquens TaxID=408 RepID=A0A2N9ALP5_METEX|nr:protein of unknown function [Methylorubrum extorquens]
MLEASIAQKPDVIIIGVGHSGTSILANVMFQLGWERNDADEVFCESVGMRELNDLYRSGTFESDIYDRAQHYLTQLRSPFALKDPRLTFTLPLWTQTVASLPQQPVLLKITRDRSQVAKSYQDRGELFEGAPGMYGRSLDQLFHEMNDNFDQWPYRKCEIQYEDLVAAAQLVGTQRAMRREGGLWHIDSAPEQIG